MNNSQAQNFIAALLPWFREQKRDLPWRHDRTGYRVWISEIMLQQTRVQTVIPYYNSWMEQWPNLVSLAKAEEQDVLKAWEGLGYYSRARNILKTAKLLVEQGATDLPASYDDLRQLPGIGDYTAAAIASLVSGEPVAAVDGNVLRVMARYLAQPWTRGNEKDLKECRSLLNSWIKLQTHFSSKQTANTFTTDIELSIEHAERIEHTEHNEHEPNTNLPGEINEALIEFGAIQCTPRNPLCQTCPLAANCAALAQGKPQDYPIPPAKTKRQTEHYTVLILQNAESGEVAVRQRPGEGLLANLWEFPLLDGHREVSEVNAYLDDRGLTVQTIWAEKPIRHVFSHLIWELAVVYAQILPAQYPQSGDAFSVVQEGGSSSASEYWEWISAKAADQLPFSAALAPLRRLLRPESGST